MNPTLLCTLLSITTLLYSLTDSYRIVYLSSIERSCIKVDPNERLTAQHIVKLLEENFVDLSSPCVNPRDPTPTQPAVPVISQNHQMPQIPGSAQPSFSLSGFTRYIKDTSSKVMQTVQK
jgi:hypothetical protein